MLLYGQLPPYVVASNMAGYMLASLALFILPAFVTTLPELASQVTRPPSQHAHNHHTISFII